MKRLALLALTAAILFVGAGWQEYSCNEGNEPAVEPGFCPAEVCDARVRHCKGRFNPLTNVHRKVVYDTDASGKLHYANLYFARVNSAWCWRDGGGIYWRNSIPAEDSDYPGVQIPVRRWYSSGCAADYSNCLTRREVRFVVGVDLPYIGTVGFSHWVCLGTRVYAGGSHSRNITETRCPGNATDKAETDLADFVNARTARKLIRACIAGSPDSTRCRSLALAAYRALSPAQRHRLHLRLADDAQ